MLSIELTLALPNQLGHSYVEAKFLRFSASIL